MLNLVLRTFTGENNSMLCNKLGHQCITW